MELTHGAPLSFARAVLRVPGTLTSAWVRALPSLCIPEGSLFLHLPHMSENFELGFGVIHDSFVWANARLLISSARPAWFCASGQNSQTFQVNVS